MLKAKLNPNKGQAITLSYRQVRSRNYNGLHSNDTIARAFKELQNTGWIAPESHGGLYRLPSAWRLTWKYDHFNAHK
jgi:hypothetical protein